MWQPKSIWIKIVVILLALLLGVNFFVLYRLRGRPPIQTLGVQGPKGPEGRLGDTGPAPVRGVDYFDGRDGRDGAAGPPGPSGTNGSPVTNEQIAAAVVAYCQNNNNCQGPTGPQGEAGPQGEPGTSGREMEVRCNQTTANEEWRHVGDSDWQRTGGKCIPSGGTP